MGESAPTFTLTYDASVKDNDEVPVWVRFLGLQMKLWTPTILSRIASKLGKPLLKDVAIVQRTRLGARRILVELRQSEEVTIEIKISESVMSSLSSQWSMTGIQNHVWFVINGGISPRNAIQRKEIESGSPRVSIMSKKSKKIKLF